MATEIHYSCTLPSGRIVETIDCGYFERGTDQWVDLADSQFRWNDDIGESEELTDAEVVQVLSDNGIDIPLNEYVFKNRKETYRDSADRDDF